MKVSKKSWHFKLVANGPLELSKSLCGHFWKVVGTLLSYLFMTIIAIVVCLACLFVLTMPMFALFVPVEPGLLIVSASVWLAVLIGIAQEKRQHKPRKSKPPKPPGLVRSYLKAKKEKVCPLIEYVDE